MPQYECDICGACCRGQLLVEAYELDVWREPRLAQADVGDWNAEMTEQELMAELEQQGKCILLACGTDKPCSFLNEENRCSIYPTRPNVCVAMQAGDEPCQQARAATGLPPLEPLAD